MNEETGTAPANPARRAALSLAITALGAGLAMIALGAKAYPWIKALHVMAIISWMAGLLYLPRIFVYHCGVKAGSETSELFKVMERRLLRIIINPAMVLSWVFGLWLAITGVHFGSAWFHAKLVLVFALSAVHGFFSAAVRRFAEDRNTTPERHWRMWNEVPAVLMILIVIFVIVKPF